jgi:phosphoglycolate phosphatase
MDKDKPHRKLVLYAFDGVFVNTRGLTFENEHQYQDELLKLPMTPGMGELVEELAREKNYVQAIISSLHTNNIRAYLENHGIKQHFFEIFGSDLGPEKSRQIIMLREIFNAKGEDTLYITGSLGGIAEARDAFALAIGVTWSYHDETTLRKGVPTTIVNSPTNLKAAIHRYLA